MPDALPRIVETEDLESAVELCYRENWTDGLPVIPATQPAVDRILRYLKRDPQEVVGIVPPCRTTHGHPGYYSFCIAEDADANPWEPLQVTRGFGLEDTVVTVTAVDAPHATASGALVNSSDQVLTQVADAIARIGSNNVYGGHTVLVFGPMAAKNLADGGYDKARVAGELKKRATRPA